MRPLLGQPQSQQAAHGSFYGMEQPDGECLWRDDPRHHVKIISARNTDPRSQKRGSVLLSRLL